MTTGTQLRLDDARARKVRHVSHRPDADELARLIADYNLLGLKKAELTAELTPVGRDDWNLRGRIGATVVQPCVVTLQPVTTRIDAPFERIYVADLPEVKTSDEIEMPEDDRVESRPSLLDLTTVFAEVLALELPEWPRAKDAALPEGVTDTLERPNPFAALEALKGKLEDR